MKTNYFYCSQWTLSGNTSSSRKVFLDIALSTDFLKRHTVVKLFLISRLIFFHERNRSEYFDYLLIGTMNFFLWLAHHANSHVILVSIDGNFVINLMEFLSVLLRLPYAVLQRNFWSLLISINIKHYSLANFSSQKPSSSIWQIIKIIVSRASPRHFRIYKSGNFSENSKTWPSQNLQEKLGFKSNSRASNWKNRI